MNIQQVSEKTRLSAHTLRYYEKIGLLVGINRDTKGHRYFTRQDLVWIEFIQRLKATNMPLTEIKKFAHLRNEGDKTISARVDILKNHERRIDQQILDLKNQKQKVGEKIELCKQGSADN